MTEDTTRILKALFLVVFLMFAICLIVNACSEFQMDKLKEDPKCEKNECFTTPRPECQAFCDEFLEETVQL